MALWVELVQVLVAQGMEDSEEAEETDMLMAEVEVGIVGVEPTVMEMVGPEARQSTQVSLK